MTVVNRIPQPITDQGTRRGGIAGVGKRAAASRSVLAALFLASLKLLVGIGTGSLGILSEAANSGLDVLAAGLIYFTVWVSDKPADANHPYGHQKVENFAAFLQTGLVFATCLWIVVAALRRLLFVPVEVEVGPVHQETAGLQPRDDLVQPLEMGAEGIEGADVEGPGGLPRPGKEAKGEQTGENWRKEM